MSMIFPGVFPGVFLSGSKGRNGREMGGEPKPRGQFLAMPDQRSNSQYALPRSLLRTTTGETLSSGKADTIQESQPDPNHENRTFLNWLDTVSKKLDKEL